MSDNPLKKWIRQSREQERRNPERYLSSYELQFDEHHVWMTQDTYDAIERNCGSYDGTFPTGQYCGKIFLRRGRLMWFGIDRENPMTQSKLNSREILIKTPGPGPARRTTRA